MSTQLWFKAAGEGNLTYIREHVDEYRRQTTEFDQTALMVAAYSFQPSIVEFLAPIEHGHSDREGNTALSLAAAVDDVSACEILLAWEKEMSLPHGQTVAMVCARSGGVRALPALLDACGDAQDSASRTVLDYAIVSGCVETVRTVLDHRNYTADKIAQSIVRAISEQNAAMAELRGRTDSLARDYENTSQALREVETSIEASKLSNHNLRCRIRSMEDYIDGIHELLRQVTHMESIDEILACLSNCALSDNIAELLAGRQSVPPVDVATSPSFNLFSCSPMTIRSTHADANAEVEARQLREILAQKDREIDALRRRAVSPSAPEDSDTNDTQDRISLIRDYRQQLEQQRLQLDEKSKTITVLQRLVGNMAMEAALDEGCATNLTVEEAEALQHVRHECLEIFSGAQAALRGSDHLATIPEQSGVGLTIRTEKIYPGDAQLRRDLADMYTVIQDLLQDSTETAGCCGAPNDTLPTMRLFTETDNTLTPGQDSPSIEELKAAFDCLARKHRELQRQGAQSGPKGTAHHDPEEADEGPQMILPCVQKEEAEIVPFKEESHSRYSEPQSLLHTQDTSYTYNTGVHTTSTSAIIPPKSISRVINVSKEDEELLRCMDNTSTTYSVGRRPVSASYVERLQDRPALDMESVYRKLNAKEKDAQNLSRSQRQAQERSVTTVSAVFGPHGVHITAKKEVK